MKIKKQIVQVVMMVNIYQDLPVKSVCRTAHLALQPKNVNYVKKIGIFIKINVFVPVQKDIKLMIKKNNV